MDEPQQNTSKSSSDGYIPKKDKNREYWNEMDFETQLIRAGEDPYPNTDFSLRTPIFMTKSYAYHSFTEMMQRPERYFYSRTENPTLFALDQKLATLHGGEAGLSVASGMAAVHLMCSSLIQTRFERVNPKKIQAAMPQNHPDHIPNILIHTNLYTGSYRLLTKIYPQMGIETRCVNMNDFDALKQAVDVHTKIIFFETPANPNIDIIDIRAVADLAHNVGAKCVVDNTFASPALQQPLKLGADFVVESLTKYINGHGDCLGGAIIGPQKHLSDIRYFWLETQGAVLSPFNAWLILRGIRTLGIRMERHSENALKVAEFLEKHPNVKNVVYPGLESHPNHETAVKQMSNFGGMIGFELDSQDLCNKMIEKLKLIKIGVSLGDTTSLLEYTPYQTGIDLSPQEWKMMRITNFHFRFSVGLESAKDIIADLDQALS
jgi:methionine-gamma-lyase